MHQFIHYEKYTLAQIIGILNEAGREPGYIPHIANPSEPITLEGDLELLQAKLELEVPTIEHDVVLKSHGKDVQCKRKIRSDANVLLAGVASYPHKKDSPDFKIEEFEDWLQYLKTFLKKKYGKRLNTVVLHLDESHPHVHFYVIPDNYQMNTLCDADKAVKAVSIELKDRTDLSKAQIKTIKTQANKKALRQYQDDYFAEVAIFCGQARLGPKRRRMSRAEYKDEVITNKLVGDCLNNTHKESLETKQKIKKLQARVNALENEKNVLKRTVEEKEIMIGLWTGLGTPTTTPEKSEDTPKPPDISPGEFGL